MRQQQTLAVACNFLLVWLLYRRCGLSICSRGLNPRTPAVTAWRKVLATACVFYVYSTCVQTNKNSRSQTNALSTNNKQTRATTKQTARVQQHTKKTRVQTKREFNTKINARSTNTNKRAFKQNNKHAFNNTSVHNK